jgi:cobalt-zinc-cadmium efflux system outer membrane protein
MQCDWKSIVCSRSSSTSLGARAEARAARDNLKILTDAAQRCSEQVRQGRRPQTDITRLSIRQARARIAVQQAEASLLHSRRNLAVLLAIPAAEADHLHICGSLRDRAPPPPSTSELIEMARQARPDLRALQLSVDRARAELRREKTESVDDFFLFFTPYQVVDLTPQGKQIASSWEIGLMIPIPSLNRNQGEIQRARVNVAQWRIEVERIEHEIVDEVRRAAAEYALSRQLVEQYERDILAPIRRRREETHHRLLEEDRSVVLFISSQHDYDEAVRAYLEALERHRRSMLRLNTAVGQRIMP